ncbi:diacylglycerol kinase [Halomonas sp. SpR1]|uniref:diacylglycerol kinase n=1 Tax=Halomonas sp. SpR1 TaxID=3050462 RepID=UPI0027E53680|nr:diacylglycerol kinase [Halomonas sp. SpR1]MDQ7732106.1 diacylglycerol kinase [Halomonas sp. SpR1]
MYTLPPQSKTNGKGIKRIFRAFVNAIDGLHACWKSEAAFRQEVVVSLFLYPLIFILDTTSVEKAILFASLTLVFVVELINSAVETTVDRISFDHHPLSGRAKDIGSAAVLLSIILMTGVWFCVLFD